MSGREPTSASFEPQRLTPQRRRLDPAVIGAFVVVLAIGAAVLKPWGDVATPSEPTAGPEAPASSPDGAVAVLPSPSSANSEAGPETPEIPVIASAPIVSWPTAAAAIRAHDRWGIRAIVPAMEPDSIDPTTGEVTSAVERWSDATDAMRRSDGASDDPLVLGSEQVVLALGLTFPRDDMALDYRVWQATAPDTWTWLDVVPLEPRPQAGTFLLGPPIIESHQPASWPTGRYRLEVLTTTGMQYLDVALPGRWERVPNVGSTAGGSDPLRSPFSPSFDAIDGAGPFVVEDGLARSVPSAPSAPGATDLESLWRDGTGVTHAPRATGIGLMLAPGTRELSATLHRVGLGGGPAAARRVTGLRFADGRSPFVIFRALRGAAWEPGTYRLDASWTDASGRRSAAYHLQLRPGSGSGPAMMRGFVPG